LFDCPRRTIRKLPLLLLLTCRLLVAQTAGETEPLGEAIFETQLADQEVEFYLAGSWQSELSGTAGLILRPGSGASKLDFFPGFQSGFLFSQVPDLTMSLWMMNRFFLELSILGSFEENFFSLGYIGSQTDILQSLVVGNRDIGIDPFPFLTIPAAGDSSLGLAAELVSGLSSHQLLLRFDNNGTGRRFFLGPNEVTESLVSLDSYTVGRHFKLPDANVTNLELFLEEPGGVLVGGDGRDYHKATADEARLDGAGGFIYLKERPSGRVAVSYTKSGLPVGTVGLGVDALATIDADGNVDPDAPALFEWGETVAYLPGPPQMDAVWKVDIDGKDSLLLFEPGVFSPFDIQASYSLPDAPAELWRTQISVVPRGSEEPVVPQPVSFRVVPEEGRFEAYVSDDPRADLRNLYPFSEELLYGPFRDRGKGGYDRELLVRTLHPVSGYFLEPDVIPGSVQVLRNGEDERRFTVNPDTGELSFQVPVRTTDLIEVEYKRGGALANNGDILFAWGNHIALREELLLDLAAGFRWNAISGAYSEKPFSRTGALLGSASLQGQLENLTFEASAGLSYSHPDTTGILRLMGMEEEGFAVGLSEDAAYPASEPDGTLLPEGTPADLSQANRGRLYYKDYREYGFGGSELLQGPGWDLPPEQEFAYATDSRAGPYNIAGSSAQGEGESLAADFELSGSDRWVGFQMPVVSGGEVVDLSSLKEILFSYRVIDFAGSGNFNVYLQIGEIGEDLDADGRLDAESSTSSSGFRFNDVSNGAGLLVGGGPKLEGNLALDTEDVEENGHLDPEVPDRILSLRVTPAPLAGDTVGWRIYEHPISADDRKRIHRARSIRIVVEGADCSGRLLIDRLAFSGTSFGVLRGPEDTANPLDKLTLQETAEAPSVLRHLEEAFPEVKDTFHASGETQKVLEIDWQSYNEADTWQVRGFSLTATEGARYGEIVLYMRLPQLTGSSPELRLALLDPQGRGVRWQFTPEANAAWRKLRLNIGEENLYIDDSLKAAAVTVDQDFGSLSRLRVAMTGTTDGTLYLDELHLRNPEGSFGGSLALEGVWTQPGVLWSVGGFPLLHDITVIQDLRIGSPGFSALYGTPALSWGSFSRTNFTIGLPFSHLALDFEAQGINSDWDLSGGHTLTVPDRGAPFSVTDDFHLQSASGTREFSRQNTLGLRTDVWNFDFETESVSRDTVITQLWHGAHRLTAPVLWDMDLKLALSSLGYDDNPGNYLASWIDGYRFVAPRTDGDILERSADLAMGIATKPWIVGLDLQASAAYGSTEITAEKRSQTNRLAYGLKLPLSLGERGELSMTLGYERTWEGVLIENAAGGFLLDAASWAARLADQPYLFNQIPIWELGGGEMETLFQQHTLGLVQAMYRPELSFTLTRGIQSHWAGLFLPAQVEVLVGKLAQREGSVLQYGTDIKLSFRTHAINVFGKFGAFPLMPFYALDEFSNTFSADLSYDDSEGTWSNGYRLENYLSFDAENESRLTLVNNFSFGSAGPYQEEANLSYSWFVRPERGIPLPFLGEEITRAGFLINEERLIALIQGAPADGAYHPFTITLSHSTNLRFPERGFLRGEIALGIDGEVLPGNGGSEILYRLGVKGKIEAKIEL
jgi:hypothetical protein